MKFPSSAVCDGNAQAKCGVGCREAANFVVNKASRSSCGDDLDFADVFLAFGVDDPDCASFLDRVSDRFQARQILPGFSGEENQICVLGQSAARVISDAGCEFGKKFGTFDAQHRNSLSCLDPKFVYEQAMCVVAFGCPRLGSFFRGHDRETFLGLWRGVRFGPSMALVCHVYLLATRLAQIAKILILRFSIAHEKTRNEPENWIVDFSLLGDADDRDAIRGR